MASPSPGIEELLQQLIQRLDAVVGQSNNTNTRLDEVLKRVDDIELAQSLAVYPPSAQDEIINPLISKTKSSSPTNSEVDAKESSIAHPGNKEDLAAVLEAAAGTPTLTKRRSASD
jgi:hypothetical protein